MRTITLRNGEDWILGDNVAIRANTKGVFHIDTMHVSVAIRAITQEVADEIVRIHNVLDRQLRVESLKFFSVDELHEARLNDENSLFYIAVDTSNTDTMNSFIEYRSADALLPLVNFNRKFERNTELLDATVKTFAKDSDLYEELLCAIAQTPTGALSDLAIDRLLNTNNDKVIIDLIGNDKVKTEKLTYLISSPSPKVRAAMAELAYIPDELRHTLLNDVKEVRLAFAMRSDLTDEEADILAKDEDIDVRNTVDEFHFA